MLHISSVLPPVMSGVGDYASLLAAKLNEISGGRIHNLLLATNEKRAIQSLIADESPIYLDWPPTSKKLTAAIQNIKPDVLLIHYVGYGFHKRGIPFWLLRSIYQVRTGYPKIYIGVMFHELYATGRFWQSSFWLSPLQRLIALLLAKLSDFWITSREGSSNWICRYAANKPHAVLPIFSNVGESVHYHPGRLSAAVVFGSPGLREGTYQKAGASLFDWAKDNDVELHDVGAPLLNAELSNLLKIHEVIQHGELAANDVSVLLNRMKYGIVRYPLSFVAKSGVFAAFCAHGVLPILLTDQYFLADGLVPNKHFLTNQALIMEFNAQLSGQFAWEWYQGHSINHHAEVFLSMVYNLNYIGP